MPAAEWPARLRDLYAGHVPGEKLLAGTDPGELMITGARVPRPGRWPRSGKSG
ncbi:hypothetical protein ACQPZZ_32970 [Microbispora sp. CA-135349]|uniref:hypothetical protein n=1 Tax=Microbispora sp. CA-135349 TaxID=3239953 RepID=UPI003D8C4E16